MSNVFKDFVPEGDDPGALGQGFKDFVPTKQPAPKKEDQEENKPATLAQPITKKK